jgi:glycosyltransferase involved in cell wall biosynthesis
VPRTALGAGHPRGLAVVRELASLASRVALLATQGALGSDVAPDPLPANVEVLQGAPEDALQRALTASDARVDVVWVGRPNNLAWLERHVRVAPHAFTGRRIVYDTEAVFALRDARRRALERAPMSDVRFHRALRQEFHPAHIVDAVAAVSDAERRAIAPLVAAPVHVLSYPAAPRPRGRASRERAGALFVGSLSPEDSPNGDSLRWLLRDVWPLCRDMTLDVVGRGGGADGWLAPLAPAGVRLHGPVADLTDLYAAARVFVAPTRYAAGIPMKVIEAAQHGVPVVATPLIAELLAWRDDHDLMVASDVASFAAALHRVATDDALWQRLADGGRAAVGRDFAPERFAATVRELVAPGR